MILKKDIYLDQIMSQNSLPKKKMAKVCRERKL